MVCPPIETRLTINIIPKDQKDVQSNIQLNPEYLRYFLNESEQMKDNSHQYAASPFLGHIVTPIAGNAVAPPASTSVRYPINVANRSP